MRPAEASTEGIDTWREPRLEWTYLDEYNTYDTKLTGLFYYESIPPKPTLLERCPFVDEWLREVGVHRGQTRRPP